MSNERKERDVSVVNTDVSEVTDQTRKKGVKHRYAEEINGHLQSAVQGIIKAGEKLIEAKESLPHGEFGVMVEENVSLSKRNARMLMKIARNDILSNRIHGSDLPTSWRTLYEATKLPDEKLQSKIKSGELNSETKRGEVKGWVSKQSSSNDGDEEPEEVTCEVSDLYEIAETDKNFGTIYADPPWSYNNKGTRASAEDHYGTMSVQQLCELPVGQLKKEESHLHLWTTNAFLFEAKEVMKSWGFEYKSCFVWVKPQMGIGNYWRVSHEFLLLGVSGGLTFNESIMSWIEEDRTKHSAKPEKIREFIEQTSPGPRIELFGRSIVDGWAVWGNEVERNMFQREVDKI